MTSRHCFFSGMREDFRHKVWMLALSVVGNLLAVPIAYLIFMGEERGASSDSTVGEALQRLEQSACRIEGFFGAQLCFTAGMIAVLGAVVVGLFGFRYLFQRNMTDLYHSLPVRRRALFFTGWLNGFLIWFVPYLASLAMTLILGECRLGMLKGQAVRLGGVPLGNWPTGMGLLSNALVSSLVVATAFLLVYHLVLLAVMLSGNLLNALTVSGILGTAAVIDWVIVTLFQDAYLDTILKPQAAELRRIVYASPLVSAVCLVYQRILMFLEEESFSPWRTLINLVIAAVLWLLAYAAYRKRNSELAESGVASVPVRLAMQIVISVTASLGGWLLFWVIASPGGMRLIWSSFGALFVGGVVFGVLDVIFHMDFKAFFCHKKLMGALLFVGLFTGFAFRFDWLGYDEYLPEEEEIAEIAIYADRAGNNMWWQNDDVSDKGNVLHLMHIRDPEAAHAFLASAVAAQGETSAAYIESWNGLADQWEDISVNAKVTLESGRSYYRRYRIYRSDSASTYALIMRPEYLQLCYRLSDEVIADLVRISLRRGSISYEATANTAEGREQIDALCAAYDRDVEENPEAVVRGSGRLMAKVSLMGRRETCQIEIYEGMYYTIEALRQAGLGYFIDAVDAADVDAIILNTSIRKSDVNEETDILESVRALYGVWTPAGKAPDQASKAGEVISCSVWEETVNLAVTDPEEIEELLGMLSYHTRRLGGMFTEQRQVSGAVMIREKNGNQYDVCIPLGALPEKYVLRFEEIKAQLLRQEWWNR